MELKEFETTVLPLRERMLIVAQRMLTDSQDAEDAVQEALIRLWQSKGVLTDHPNVGGYAMQTVKNVCLNKIKARKQNVPLDQMPPDADLRTPYMQTELNDSAAIIQQIISQLPALQQLVITMRDMEEYEMDEIARIAGSNVAAVKVNLSRARKRVRDEFIRIQSSKNTR